MAQLTKEQREAKNVIAEQHLDCASVECFFGAHASAAPYGDLVLRFETGSVPHVYLIDHEGRTTKLGVWP